MSGSGTGGDYSGFVWQQLSEIQKSLGALDSTVKAQAELLSKLGTKVDDVKKDVHGINLKLAVATGVVIVAAAVAGWAFSQVWDVAKPMLLKRLTSEPPVAAPAPATAPVATPAPPQSATQPNGIAPAH